MLLLMPRALGVLVLLHLLLARCDSPPATEVDFALGRKEMVVKQLAGPGRDIRNLRVLDAMGTVPRHEFVPGALRQFSYQDEPLPIGYGQTITYGELAAKLAGGTTAYEVGQAVGRNPLSIIVPCHRVVGKDGALTGYAGGLKRKRFLLDLEEPVPAAAGRK